LEFSQFYNTFLSFCLCLHGHCPITSDRPSFTLKLDNQVMFGFGKKSPSTPGQAALEEMGQQQQEEDHKSSSRYKGGGGFDPTGLERAARAAKVLDASPNARHALDVVRAQNETKSEEHRVKAAEYEAYGKQQEVLRVQREAEEARKTLEAQTEQDKRRAEYRDQLERKRYVDQINAERNMKDQEMRRQEELVKRQEAIKRKTLEYEAELRQQTELARVKAETEGRIRQERENHDLRLEEARVSAEEYRDTVLESIKLAGSTVGEGMKAFLSDQSKIVAATSTITAIALGVYTARTGTGVAGRYIEARLGKPSLVRETSRRTFSEFVRVSFGCFTMKDAGGHFVFLV
jgi:ATPase family AAA domain-containing protein 3A/B